MKLTAPKQRQGEHYETLACQYLQTQGLTLIAKNWHYKNMGELDLVMLDKTNPLLIQNPKIAPCLVFIEVRQRKISIASQNFGTAEDSITLAKQKKIIKTANAFLTYFNDFAKHDFNHFNDFDIRFDVVTFSTFQNETKIDWIKSAFWVV